MHKSVTIGGTAMVLKYPFHSLCRMEEEFKVNVFNPDTWSPSPRFAAIVIWGGLIHAKPDLKLIDVTGGIEMKDFKTINKTAMEVLVDSLPEAEKETDAAASAKS